MTDNVPGTGPVRRFRRLFSVEEANALLPVLIPKLEHLQREKEEFDRQNAALDALTPAMRSNGHALKAITHEQRISELMTALSRNIQEIAELGVEIKDLNRGLIDFPHEREGRIVYLCWKLGEGRLEYWHELDGGFAWRQPLD